MGQFWKYLERENPCLLNYWNHCISLTMKSTLLLDQNIVNQRQWF